MGEQQEVSRTLDVGLLHNQYGATFTHIIGESTETLRSLVSSSPRPILLSSWRPEVYDDLLKIEPSIKFHPLSHEVAPGLNALNQIRDIVMSAYVEGFFGSTDRILCITRIGAYFESVLFVDMRYDESVTRLKKDLEGRADIHVIETVLQIAGEIAREGREKGHVGAIFVIGDTERVMKVSRQVVINPFFGHPPEDRDILHPSTWETAKEFSQIDGAFIIREDGIIEAAGRYIEVKNPVALPSGLGGRHLAAAAVSKETRAIAIAVSETGVIRIFKDGEIVMRIGTS